MASTYLSLYYHIVFSTQNREPCIDSTWRDRLHEYLGGTVNRLDALPASRRLASQIAGG